VPPPLLLSSPVLSGAEVLLAMLSHAHSTESEEVMGLLLGDIRVRARRGWGRTPRENA
jgi:hypothetical protein